MKESALFRILNKVRPTNAKNKKRMPDKTDMLQIFISFKEQIWKKHILFKTMKLGEQEMMNINDMAFPYLLSLKSLAPMGESMDSAR